MTAISRLALAAIVALASLAAASIGDAGAMQISKRAVASPSPARLKVHHDSWNDDWDHEHHRPYHHRHRHPDAVVDAPFAHVETGRHTVVDAPFTHVYVGRHGRHIVAPFVDLWIPR